jgi:hypothetical protein
MTTTLSNMEQLFSLDSMMTTRIYDAFVRCMKQLPNATWPQRLQHLGGLLLDVAGVLLSQQLAARSGSIVYLLYTEVVHYIRSRGYRHCIRFAVARDAPTHGLSGNTYTVSGKVDIDGDQFDPTNEVLHELHAQSTYTFYSPGEYRSQCGKYLDRPIYVRVDSRTGDNVTTFRVYMNDVTAIRALLMELQETRDRRRASSAVAAYELCAQVGSEPCLTSVAGVSLHTIYETPQLSELKVKVSECLEMKRLLPQFTLPAIVLNGEPGVGKTVAFDYLAGQFRATNDLCPVRVRMLQFTSQPISYVLEQAVRRTSSVKSTPNQHILLFLDEVDKYLDSHVLEHKDDEHAPEERRRIAQKRLLRELLLFLDTSASVIVMFACNEFETIFQGEELHYAATRTRFLEKQMLRFDCSDVAGYLRHLNALIPTTSHLHCHTIDAHLAALQPNVSCTTRVLNQLILDTHVSYQRVVEMLNATTNVGHGCRSDLVDEGTGVMRQ